MDDREGLVLDEYAGTARLTGKIKGFCLSYITLATEISPCLTASIDLDRDGAVILRDWLNKYLGE